MAARNVTHSGSSIHYKRSFGDVIRGRKMRDFTWISVCTLLVMVGTVFVITPILWMLSTSFKTMGEVFIIPPVWIPAAIQWENYPKSLAFMRASTVYQNTTLVTLLCIIGETLGSSLAAFGFSRLRAPGRNFLFVVMLSTLMLPFQVTLIPQFIIFKQLGWIDTLKPLVVPAFFGTPFFIFLLRQFYMTISPEMDDAARIDGCGYFGLWWRIIVPLSKPALGVVAIQSFMFHWNEFMRPLIYLNTRSNYTAALALRNFTAEYGATPWNELMAASLVMMLPCILLFFIAQRYFIEGIVFTGVKG
ncbi:MAG: carbohydrate ABC transporter permease [Caldilineaceae bacterium]